MKTIKVKDYSQVPRNFSGKVEFESGGVAYHLNGKRHRLDGPAYVRSDGYKEYWINGKYICDSYDKDYEQTFYNSKQYRIAKRQEDLLNNFKLIKNIKEQ